MKHVLLLIGLLAAGIASGQSYRHPAANATHLKLVNIPGDVELHAYGGAEIQITCIPEEGKNIAVQGNSGIGLQVTTSGSAVEIKGLLSKRIGARYVLQVPKKIAIDAASEGLMNAFSAEGMQGDVNITTTGDVTLGEMEGGIAVQSADGNVAIKKPSLPKDKPISVITQGGNVLISLNEGANAKLKLGTATGKILVMIKNSNGGNLMFSGKQLTTSVGKGGAVLQVQTLSGNVSIMETK